MSSEELNALNKKQYVSLNLEERLAAAEKFLDLGLMYSTGKFGEPDPVTAHSLFNLAAIGGNESAKEYRQQIASELDTAQMAKAQRLARDWIQGA